RARTAKKRMGNPPVDASVCGVKIGTEPHAAESTPRVSDRWRLGFLLDLGEAGLFKRFLGEHQFKLLLRFGFGDFAFAVVAAEGDLGVTDFDFGFGIQRATAQRAGLLFVLPGGDELLIGIGGKLFWGLG